MEGFDCHERHRDTENELFNCNDQKSKLNRHHSI